MIKLARVIIMMSGGMIYKIILERVFKIKLGRGENGWKMI